MRTVSFDIPPQEILTKDSVTIAVDAVVYYKISNANGEFVSWEFFAQDLSNILFNDLIIGGVSLGADWNNRFSNHVYSLTVACTTILRHIYFLVCSFPTQSLKIKFS